MPAWELAHKASKKQNKKNATAFLFLAKEPQKGMGEQSEANPEQTRQREARLPADEKRKLEETRQRSCFLQRNHKKGWASKAKPIPNKHDSGKLAYRLTRKGN
ncbi:MAG: hypothetical protein IJ436_05355 [Bacteroidaceae bacterium]|nr:hypothetical protein [Bacteroidaceae bacterium]